MLIDKFDASYFLSDTDITVIDNSVYRASAPDILDWQLAVLLSGIGIIVIVFCILVCCGKYINDESNEINADMVERQAIEENPRLGVEIDEEHISLSPATAQRYGTYTA